MLAGSLNAAPRPVFGPKKVQAACSSCNLTSVASRRGNSVSQARCRSQRLQQCLRSVRAEAWNPPTVSDTKQAFYESFKKPIPPVYNTVIQELLVQQHLLRWNSTYQYDEVFALGFVSVFDQIVEGLPGSGASDIFEAYVKALKEDPEQYRRDAKQIEEAASKLSDSSELAPSSEGNEVQTKLGAIADRAEKGDFFYTKFFAIGLFRLLELTGAKDPTALETLVKSMNVKTESVNRDLTSYKGILSKLNAAKELMAELLQREKKKQAERDAEKAAAKQKEAEPAEAKA